MTSIEFNFTKPDGSPDTGTITFTPTRRNRYSHGVSLPEPFAVPLTDQGAFSVDLKPTPAHWLWRITTQVGTYPWDTSYFYVPDRNFPLRYEDLTPVDPSTVQTGLNPEPAWWAHVDAVKASADEIGELVFRTRKQISETEEILSAIEQSGDTILERLTDAATITARNLNRCEEILYEVQRGLGEVVDAGKYADRAEAAADQAEGHADTAEGHADTAQTAASQAETARDTTQGLLDDFHTPWQTLNMINGWDNHNHAPLQYQVVGDMVHISGVVTQSSNISWRIVSSFPEPYTGFEILGGRTNTGEAVEFWLNGYNDTTNPFNGSSGLFLATPYHDIEADSYSIRGSYRVRP